MNELLFFVSLAVNAHTFEEATIPAVRKEILASCRVAPAVSVEWVNFGQDNGGKKAFVDSGLKFLSAALRQVCSVAAMRAELGKQVDKIVLSQAYGAADPMIYISERALHVEYLWVLGEPPPDAAAVASQIA